MFPQLASERAKRAKALSSKPGSANAPSAAITASNFFYPGSTKEINVLENRYLQPAVHIAHDPSDVEQRL